MQISESTIITKNVLTHAESWQWAGDYGGEELRLTAVTVWLWPFTVT